MIWTIRPQLTACTVGKAVILLDLRDDRYLRVPSDRARLIYDWFARGGGAAPPAVAEFLVQSRLVGRGEVAAIDATAMSVSIPSAVPEHESATAAANPGAARIASRVLATWLSLRTRRLEAVIRNHRAQRLTLSTAGPDLSAARLAAYHRARRLVPIRKNCLLDSLALDRWLGDASPPRTIIVGVTAEPFLAHCWLQTGDMLLNDHPDHVRRYAPILVV